MSVAFCCGSGAWCRVWHIPGRCRQPPAASARSRSGCRSHPSLASQNQARSSRSAPAAARGRGAPNVAGRPPGPRSARPGHRPQPAPSFAKLRAPPPAPASFVTPCLRPPRCGCCAPLRLVPRLRCLEPTVSRSCLAVAAGPLASRHPPRKNFGRWGPARGRSPLRPNF